MSSGNGCKCWASPRGERASRAECSSSRLEKTRWWRVGREKVEASLNSQYHGMAKTNGMVILILCGNSSVDGAGKKLANFACFDLKSAKCLHKRLEAWSSGSLESEIN